MINLLVQKCLAVLAIVSLSLLFGLLPLLLAKKYDLGGGEVLDPHLARKERKKFKNVVLSFLLNLGGGVLLANCFCHWLPEVREGLDHHNIDSVLPLAEVIMSAGFFLICGLEELLHHFFIPHKDTKTKNENKSLKNSPKIQPLPSVDYVDDMTTDTEMMEKEAENIKTILRTGFVLMALSFHSIVEGLALSLESESPGVWLNTGATALHKFVISFSLGVELVSNKVSKWNYMVSIIVFSVAPALGCFLGILIEMFSVNNSVKDLPLQILQGIATGTIVYVIFFEIFPKAKSVGGTGFQHVTSMVLGFCLFLPSLLLHSGHEEKVENCITRNVSTGEHA